MTAADCILALDFDGVVWDSVGESCFVASRAWQKLYGALPANLEPGFRAGRWLVRTGLDFYLLVRLLKEDPHIDFAQWTKARFAAALAEHMAEAERFDHAFYATRDEERTTRAQHWLSLQPPYPEFLAAFPTLQQAFKDIVVTTTKDEASVTFLLGQHHIDLPVLGRAFSREKAEQIRWLSGHRRVPLSNIILLDDLLDNLFPVRAAGSPVALATWGYNTPEEQQDATRDGIPLIRPDHILADLQHALACA